MKIISLIGELAAVVTMTLAVIDGDVEWFTFGVGFMVYWRLRAIEEAIGAPR